MKQILLERVQEQFNFEQKRRVTGHLYRGDILPVEVYVSLPNREEMPDATAHGNLSDGSGKRASVN